MKYILVLLCLLFVSCKKEPSLIPNPDYEQNKETVQGNPDLEEEPEEEPEEAPEEEPEEEPDEKPEEGDKPIICFLPDGEHIFNHDITACGVKDPITNFPWLADLIETAKKDTKAYYKGRIYLEQYKGQDLFVVCWYVESIGRRFLDCSGNNFVPDDYSEFITVSLKMKLDVIVYANTTF